MGATPRVMRWLGRLQLFKGLHHRRESRPLVWSLCNDYRLHMPALNST
jgi:hypothetical protein